MSGLCVIIKPDLLRTVLSVKVQKLQFCSLDFFYSVIVFVFIDCKLDVVTNFVIHNCVSERCHIRDDSVFRV